MLVFLSVFGFDNREVVGRHRMCPMARLLVEGFCIRTARFSDRI
jgi:hypothetical protein